MLFICAKDDRLAGTVDVADGGIGIQNFCMCKKGKDPGSLTLRGGGKGGRKPAYGTGGQGDDASCEV